MTYSDDVRQPLLGAGRAEKADGPAPPSYTAFSAAGAGADVEDGPGEAFFSSPAGAGMGVAERAGFLSFLLPGHRSSSHQHYYYVQQGLPATAPARCNRRHRRSCCRTLCMHLCCLVLLTLLALYVGGVSLGLIGRGFRFWSPSSGKHDGDNLPPLAPDAPGAPAHTLPSHAAPPMRVTLPPPSPSAPLAGALFMPGRQCREHNSGRTVSVIPATTYSVAFGADAALAVAQNVTRWGPDAAVGGAASFLDPLDADVAESVVGELRRVPVQVYGDVVIRTGARAGVEVEALANDERIRAEASFDAARQRLAMTVDDGVWESADTAPGTPETDPWPCLVVRATVWVPAAATAAELRNLEVEAVHLGVVVGDDVALAVREHIRLVSVVGDVDGHYDVADDKASTKTDDATATGYVFDAPSVTLASTTGHIHGLWSRRNRLVAATKTGDIAVAVRPLPLAEHHHHEDDDKEHLGLANLVLDTTSGNIDLREAAGDPAAPPHRLIASTKTGHIAGEASFAQYAGLHSDTGALAPRLTVVRWAPAPEKPAVHAFLGTDTVSGATDVTVSYDAAAAAAEPLDFLRANHRAVSGTIALHYPAAWAGHIELISRFGRAVAAHGDHVVELPTGPHGSPFGRRLIAEKDVVAGAPQSNITATTVTGAIDLSF